MPAWTAEPNAGHLAIVELERQGKLHAVVTQNIDELHQRAGTDPDKVVEVHGTVLVDALLGVRRPAADGARRWIGCVAGEEDPPCLVCGGIIKSDTISFGQALVPDVIDRAMQVSGECDVMLAVGSTLSVYPVAQLRADRQVGRRQGRDRQPRGDRDGRHRRRQSSTARSATCSPALVHNTRPTG